MIAEYDADEKGLNALDAGVDGTSFSPRAGLRVMDIFKKGRKTNSYTLTHPHPHRRLAKMFNDIRRRYWKNLDKEPHPLPSDELETERTAPFKFNEELYSTFSSSHLEKMAVKAGSLLDIRKIVHLHHAFTVFRAILNSFQSENSPVSLDLRIETLQPLLDPTTSPSDGASFVLKWITDEGLNPTSFFSPGNLAELKRIFPDVPLTYDLLARIVADQTTDWFQQFREEETEEEDHNSFSWIFSDAPIPPGRSNKKNQREFIQSQINQIEKESGAGLKGALKEKAGEVVPGLSSLTSEDQNRMIESYVLIGFKFLEGAFIQNESTPASDTEISKGIGPMLWQDPSAVLQIYFSTLTSITARKS